MSSARSLWDGFAVMIGCIATAIVLILSVGKVIDELLETMISAGIFDVSETWDFTGVTLQLTNVFYLGVYTLIIFGVVVFIISATRRQRYDRYYPPGGEL